MDRIGYSFYKMEKKRDLCFLVCDAGYFKSGTSCLLCGNATGCDGTCDEPATVPNDQRTACGEFVSSVSRVSVH